MLGKVEERVVLEQSVMEVIALGIVKFHVRGDAAAAVNGATAIRELHFFVGVVVLVAFEVIVVERYVAVIALNQPAAGRVVLRRSQCQSGVIG